MSNRPKPRTPLDEYIEAQPLLLHVRIMRRFFHEVVDKRPGCGPHYSALFSAYMDILNEELAPHALTFAVAIVELEDAFPAITRGVAAVDRD